MGVDDHLQRFGGKGRSPVQRPSFDDEKLFSASAPVMPEKLPDSSLMLGSDIKKLDSSINDLLSVFRKAHEDIRAEPTADLAAKMDKLIEQNEEIARALLLLLELHREHLPQISKHTRVSSELRLRKPSRLMFPGSK